MTLNTDLDRVALDCDGVQDDFDFTFTIFVPKDFEVYLIIDPGSSKLELGSDYEGVGDDFLYGGIVHTNVVYSDVNQLEIVRAPSLLQEKSFRNLGEFFRDSHENAFDCVYMILQHFGYRLNKVLIHGAFDIWVFENKQSKNVSYPEAGEAVANAAFVFEQIKAAQEEANFVAPLDWDEVVAPGEYTYPLNGADLEDEKGYRVFLGNTSEP